MKPSALSAGGERGHTALNESLRGWGAGVDAEPEPVMAELSCTALYSRAWKRPGQSPGRLA